MAWKKCSPKLYQIELDGRYVDVPVPYIKVEKIFSEFMGNGGLIDPTTGLVTTDLMILISSFGSVGDAVLTEYDEQCRVVKAGNCRSLSFEEVPELFEIAVDVIENFIGRLSRNSKSPQADV